MKHLNLDLDTTLASNSNVTVSSQKALKTYIDTKINTIQFIQSTTPTSFNTGDKWVNTTDLKLYTATSSSEWDNGTSILDGQIFSFNNLLYHLSNQQLIIYSTQSITEQNELKEIKVWYGTQEEYDAIDTKDENTNYKIIDSTSEVPAVLATQEQFNNSVTNKAATPAQVNEKIGNYLPLAGGNMDAGAVLRLTNTNNQVTTIAYDTDQNLTLSNNLKVTGSINGNNLVVTSGNIYKGSTLGATNVWTDTIATADTAGIVKVDGTTITITNDGTISASGSTTPDNMVTTDTAQTISGSKTFTGAANMFDIVKLAVVQDSWSKEVARFLKGELQLGHIDDDLIIKSSGTNTINGNVIIDSANISQYIPVQGQSIYQNKTSLTDGTINLTDDCSIYLSSPTGNITYTFNTSGLTLLSSKIVTFELLITLPSTSITCTFPTIKWLDGNEPSLVAGALNLLAFRTVDGGTTWIGNLQGVIQ